MVDHTAQEGGAELALLRLAEALRADGAIDLRVLLFARGPLEERLTRIDVPVEVLPLDERVATARRDRAVAAAAGSAIATLRFVPRLARAIRASDADLVVANSLKSAVFAFLAAPLARRPWVWHLHDRLAADYLPKVMVLAMRGIAAVGPRAVIANSHATLSTLPARARRRSVVAYPGLPPTAFADPATDPQPPTVGIIGRVSPTKGQREFLDAASIVVAGRPGVRYRVIGGALFGEDDYEEELHAHVRELGIDDRVEFTGWVDDVPVRLRGLTLLVHASPVPEPFGQVIVEAMAAGVPVVAAAAGGVLEILGPDGPPAVAGFRVTPTGILVAPGDVKGLAAAIEVALDDDGARIERARVATADAATRFGIEETARIVRDVWVTRVR